MTDVLTAIDDALDTGVAADDDPLTRELQELALVLRDDAPEPTPEFRERLDWQVESTQARKLCSRVEPNSSSDRGSANITGVTRSGAASNSGKGLQGPPVSLVLNVPGATSSASMSSVSRRPRPGVKPARVKSLSMMVPQ